MTLCLQGIRSNHLSYIDKCTEWDLNPRSIRSRSWVYPLWPLGNLCINIHDGTRTRNPQIRSLVRYPITLHGQILTRVNRTPDKWIYSPLLYQLSYSEKKKGSAGTWTRVVRFKVWSANHYTTEPDNIKESEYCRGLKSI